MTVSTESEVYLLPTSFGQDRIYFFEKMFPNSATYNIPFIFKLRGTIQPQTLEKALSRIVEKHEILRTTITEVEGEPMQKVSLSPSLSFKQLDKREIERTTSLEQYMQDFALRPFDFKSESLIRFELICIKEELYYLLINVHHIAFDAWSIDLLKKEILTHYTSIEEGTIDEGEELELQYGDFAGWERGEIDEEAMELQMDFWRGYLDGAPPQLELPTDFIRPLQPTYEGDNVRFSIPQELLLKVREYAKSNKATPYSFFLAAFNVLLYRYTGQKDIVVGTPVANRSEIFTHDLLGFFVNTLPIRSTINPYSKFPNFLKKSVQNFIQTFEYSNVPFERIVQAVNPERITSTQPIFQVMFTFHEGQRNDQNDSFLIEHEKIYTKTSKFDLVLYIGCDDKGGIGEIEYSSEIFTKTRMKKFIAHYLLLIEEILKQPNKPISKMKILDDHEKKELTLFKESHYPTNLFFHEWFEETVRKHEAACAVKDKLASWTYKHLNTRADQIANELIKRGVRAPSRIGIQMTRSNEQLAALLAVFKIGCSYIPLDPSLPVSRREYILKDSGAVLLIQDEEYEGSGVPVLFTKDCLIDQEVSVPKLLRSPHETEAYVIYTSGTTGKPKGVSVSQASLLNHINAYVEAFPFVQGERMLQNINYTFDASITEIFSPLVSGAALVLSDSNCQFDVDYLAELIRSEGVTRAQLFHSLIERLIEHQSFTSTESLRYIFTGGEALNRRLVLNYYDRMSKGVPLINLYGPTEATVASTYFYTTPEHKETVAPIGIPFSNYRLAVLDENQELVPVGVTGELYIGGNGVCNGYINQPQLDETFFLELDVLGKVERFYRTGDLVKRLCDGNLLFVSRKDSQVKIRGFRIELDEIKQCVLKQQEIQDAAVVVEKVGEEKKLFVFAVRSEGSSFSANALKDRMSEELPHYMVPNVIVFMEKIPINKHGKLLKADLPFSKNDLVRSLKRRPSSLLETELVSLWEKVLGTKDISIDDDFFDLGGHSIKVIEVVGYIRKTLKVQLPISSLFQYRTVETLAKHIKENNFSAGNVIVPLKREGKNAPLFIVHPGGGGALCYISLADHLKIDHPIYGIQSVGYDSDELSPLKTIPLMAERYVEEIQKIQPSGPYLLAGWSMGGTLSVEMTRILESQGEEVAFIGLLDAHPFDHTMVVEKRDPLVVYSQNFGLDPTEFERLNKHDQYSLLLHATKERNVLPQNAELEDVKRILNIMAINNQASDYYIFSEPIKTDLTVFCCSERDPNHFHTIVDPSDWEKRTTGKVEAVYVHGHHNNVMSSPYVQYLGQKMTDMLKGRG